MAINLLVLDADRVDPRVRLAGGDEDVLLPHLALVLVELAVDFPQPREEAFALLAPGPALRVAIQSSTMPGSLS